MNKNILWGSIGVVVVVVMVWLIISTNNEPVDIAQNDLSTETIDKTNTPIKTVVSTKTVKTTPTATFTNILPRLGNYQCDYEEVTQSTRSTNTVYLADGKMRAEFRSKDSVGNGTGSIMVYDGVNLYTWTEGKTTGTVSQPKSLADFPSIIPRDLVAAKVLGSGLNSASWYCHAWSKDSSMLQKPSYLKV